MTAPVRYFYDLEFLEDGSTIDLISIGIVCDDGREYYAVSSEFDQDRVLADKWMTENVWPYLPTRLRPVGRGLRQEIDADDPSVKSRATIAVEVRSFLLAAGGRGRWDRELWASFGAYDHVALCQLWGRMIDLPDGIPMFTHDIQQEATRLCVDELPAQTSKDHHALADARHCKVRLDWLRDVERRRGLATARV